VQQQAGRTSAGVASNRATSKDFTFALTPKRLKLSEICIAQTQTSSLGHAVPGSLVLIADLLVSASHMG
jgi:hypothetical protein